MQDVSYEPLLLCPSENPQASLDIFSPPHHHPFTVFASIARRQTRINLPCPLAYCHLGSGVLVRHHTILLPSRQQRHGRHLVL